MIHHHPSDALLTSFATGRLAPGLAVVVGVHVDGCPRCLDCVQGLQAVGGALLDLATPAPLSSDALERTLARLGPSNRPEASGLDFRADLPPGVVLPESVQPLAATRWHRIAPGVRWSRITLPDDMPANLYLLRVDAGKELPFHSHDGVECTQVLHGAFEDGDRRLAAGDFESSDADVHHRPTASGVGECICLVHVSGRVAFSGPLARMLGALLRL